MATCLTRKTPLVCAATATVMVAVGALLPSSTAFAQDTGAVAQRLERIERDISTLSDAVYRGETPARPPASYAGTTGNAEKNPALAADMQVRLGEIESNVRRLTGQIEEQNFKIRQLSEKLDTVLSDIEVRFQQMQGQNPANLNGAVTNPELPQTTLNPDEQTATGRYTGDLATTLDETSAPPASGVTNTLPVANNNLASGDAASVYDSAFQHIRAGNYAKAEEGLKDFLSQFSGHSLAPNAEYWLAETYYVRGQYAKAAQAFAKGYQNHPKSSKAPDNLLKLALSLSGLDRKDDACLALEQLSNDFPSAGQTITDRVIREKTRLSCP